MKKTVVVLASMFAILLSACSQIPGFSPTPATGPTINATSVFETAVAQTLTAQPTLPSVSVTDTATLPGLVESPTLPPATDTQIVLPTQVFTSVSNLTTTPATATPVNVTATATLAAGQLTASPTLGIRKYGTLPPAVPFNRITLSNKSKAEAYISLQVTMPDGKFSILEYPVQGTFKVEAPVGSYLYVAWVGGRKMVGTFKLTASDELLIILYKSKVVIK